ncbi:MAG: heme o synthase [Bellilinea sp.]
MSESSVEHNNISSFRKAMIAAAIMTFLLVMAGYLVRFDGSQGSCPDWPTCYGNWGIPSGLAGWLEMGHRILAFLTGLMVLGMLIWSVKVRMANRVIRVLLFLALAGVALGAIAGRQIVFDNSDPLLSNLHLGLAMVVMAFVTSAAVIAFRPIGQTRSHANRSGYARLTLVTLASIFILMTSGAWLTSSGAGQACSGWPLCAGGFPTSSAAWLAFSHRILTLVSGILVGAMFFTAWRRYYHQSLILTTATGSGLLFAGQVLISALKVSRGYPIDLIALHAAATAALWAVVVVGAVAAIVLPNQPVEVAAASRPAGFARFKAFVMLNKPIIVLLLLVTTFAGMVVGARQMPGIWPVFWTMIGGALAAGGASALNQVIDREIDGQMQRTAKRPLPSGALTPAEGLAYGLGACLAAFFILAGFVNLLAAVLSLAGMIYYVLLYSVWLKHATVQNIVIGGGAGAIPPLVGWAAATGSLNIPSLFLFAIVFMWTPPHFWALAIVRKNDYARAGVPMLPVVEGERKTRVQIFIYTLELVGLTLLMPLFNMAGSLFLVSAIALGLWLIYAAWKVLRVPGNKVAWMMYRYSSMYLAFIFLALVLDVLI